MLIKQCKLFYLAYSSIDRCHRQLSIFHAKAGDESRTDHYL
jgi:hypothetical protein